MQTCENAEHSGVTLPSISGEDPPSLSLQNAETTENNIGASESAVRPLSEDDTTEGSPDCEGVLDADLLNSLAPSSKKQTDNSDEALEDSILPISPGRESIGSATVTSPEMKKVIEKVQSQKEDEPDVNRDVYLIKWIRFKDRRVPIVTQTVNGPCPLIALVNVLLLTNRIRLRPSTREVNSTQLMGYLGDLTLSSMPKGMREGEKANYEQTVDDAIAVFHKLQTGLDVNVKFTGVGQFEFTRELSVFDLLSVQLFHGWLVDPVQASHAAAIGDKTYNQLVEMIIDKDKCQNDDELQKALLAEQFLESSASQLTYHGLAELSMTLTDGQLAVFFRNNHFSTILKRKNELFLLVTDQGYVHTSQVVWETLANVEGDGQLVDSEFLTVRSDHSPVRPPTVPIGSQEQMDSDLLLAMSLQQQEPATQKTTSTMTDEEYARQLHQQELLLAQGNMQSSGPVPQNQPPQLAYPPETTQSEERTERPKSCTIL